MDGVPLDKCYFATLKSENCFLTATSKEADIIWPNLLQSEKERQRETERERERAREREREGERERERGGGGFIKAPGISPAHSEYVNVSGTEKNTAREKQGEKRGERARGGEQHEKVSERSREREQESEGKRASTLNCEWLTTLSEQKVLLHALSVYCSAARDCALLRFPHLPPLPADQHQPSAASSSWLRKHPESKGENEKLRATGDASGFFNRDEPLR